ncbi:MAG TPA: CocE/NonD family hydrolase [Acidobacteriaceae bacterium]|nr:CocE/NonD family hydrolase [Acidobacteriaceae bacterium]
MRRRTAIAVLVLCAGIAVVRLAAWPAVRAHLQALCVLDEVGGIPQPWFSRWLTSPVTTEDLNFSAPDGRIIQGRIYQPAGHPNAPGMVVLHGIDSMGIEEPRLKGFARAMAGCGLRVLTPQLPAIADYHVDSDSVQTIGESVRWFAQRTDGRVGVMGLSFSGGLALVTASEPQYQPYFSFVFAVGAHDSMARVVSFYETGRDVRPDGTVEVLTPHEYGPLVLEYQHLASLVPPSDLAAVRAVMRADLYEDKQAKAQAMAALTVTQRQEIDELMQPNSPGMRAKLAPVIAGYAGEMQALSPEGHIEGLQVPVYLLHGQGDNVIPAAETLWIAKQLPPERLKGMLISPVLSHVDVDEKAPGARDEWQLVHLFAHVLESAERR